MDKINLHSIRMNVLGRINPHWTPAELADECMKEAIHQALILASEKAKIKNETIDVNLNSSIMINNMKIVVDKQSILDVEQLIILNCLLSKSFS